jgi:hypothetical protein
LSIATTLTQLTVAHEQFKEHFGNTCAADVSNMDWPQPIQRRQSEILLHIFFWLSLPNAREYRCWSAAGAANFEIVPGLLKVLLSM